MKIFGSTSFTILIHLWIQHNVLLDNVKHLQYTCIFFFIYCQKHDVLHNTVFLLADIWFQAAGSTFISCKIVQFESWACEEVHYNGDNDWKGKTSVYGSKSHFDGYTKSPLNKTPNHKTDDLYPEMTILNLSPNSQTM